MGERPVSSTADHRTEERTLARDGATAARGPTSRTETLTIAIP
jgi:hypothetical protein